MLTTTVCEEALGPDMSTIQVYPADPYRSHPNPSPTRPPRQSSSLEAFPSRSVQLIVSASQTGLSSAVARLLSEKLARVLGHPVAAERILILRLGRS